MHADKIRRQVLFLACSLCFMGAFFSEAFAQGDPDKVDVRLFRSINNARSDFIGGMSNIIDYSVYPISVGLPLSFIGYGVLADALYEEESGFLLAASELVSIAIYAPMKSVIKRPRPYVRLPNVHVGHRETSSLYSFPSGHSSLAVSIAALLSLRYPRPQVYLPVFTWALLVGYSRIYYGLHYPSDVLAGTAIGIGSAVLIHYFSEEVLEITRKLFGNGHQTSFHFSPIDGGYMVTLKVSFKSP